MTIYNHLFALIVSVQIFTGNALATPQVGDVFIAGKDTFSILENPLDNYFTKKGSRTINGNKFSDGCSALWRGYVATWLFENKKLYLIRVQVDYCSNPIDLDLTKEFGSEKILADWMNETIKIPKGNKLQYIFGGNFYIHDEEIVYSFKKGELLYTEVRPNIEYKAGLVYPGESFLKDTIRDIIVKAIDDDTRGKIDTGAVCTIRIVFNKAGEVASIRFEDDIRATGFKSKAMADIIIAKARIALKDFPKLMKINHQHARNVIVLVHFNGSLLSSPS